MTDKSFFKELVRRKVFRAAAIYGAVAWGVTEVIVTVTEQLFLPQWISTLAVIGFVVGFPVAMFLAWTFDLTSEGLHRTEISSTRGKASIMISMLLLVAGTAGLFFLIRPALDMAPSGQAPAAIAENSLAVLPFENLGTNPDDTLFGAGFSVELGNQLSEIQGIRVAAKSSAAAVRELGLDAIAAADKLRVANLVEGSIRRQGNRLTLSVQLIEGSNGLSVWSKTFKRGSNELLGVQQEIAEQIVRHLLPDQEHLLTAPATRDPTAHELMILAQDYEKRVLNRKIVDEEALLEAVRLYRMATEADPESALAHARLGGALLYLGDYESARVMVFKAMALNPNLSEVQNTLGDYYWSTGQVQQAREAYGQAVEMNLNNVEALINYASTMWLSVKHKNLGINDLAIFFRRAVELDRLSLSSHAALGDFLGKEGRADEVREVIRDIQELFDGAESYRVIAWLKELVGEVDEAIAWTIRARDLEPHNPDHVSQLAELYVVIGDVETAMRLEPEPSVGLLFAMRRYDELIEEAEFLMIDEPENISVRYVLAFAHNVSGNHESAIHVLRRTGLPQTMIEDRIRSIAEILASFPLMLALKGTGDDEMVAMARSLASLSEEEGYWGDPAWVALARTCDMTVLDRPDEALKILADVKESHRLLSDTVIRDSPCYTPYVNEPVYQEILSHHEQRQAELRNKLPETLATFGVEL